MSESIPNMRQRCQFHKLFVEEEKMKIVMSHKCCQINPVGQTGQRLLNWLRFDKNLSF